MLFLHALLNPGGDHAAFRIEGEQLVAGAVRPGAHVAGEAEVGGFDGHHISRVHFLDFGVKLQNRSGALQPAGIHGEFICVGRIKRRHFLYFLSAGDGHILECVKIGLLAGSMRISFVAAVQVDGVKTKLVQDAAREVAALADLAVHRDLLAAREFVHP